MREVIDRLAQWWHDGHTVAVGTVVRTWKSAPRLPGATMLVGPGGEAVGSVSGGCVEAAVYAVAEDVRGGGAPRLEHYGVSDDDAFAVGLTCGGTIDVFVDRVSKTTFPGLGGLAEAVSSNRPVALVTIVAGPRTPPDTLGTLGTHVILTTDALVGTLGSDRLDAAVANDARGLLDQGRTAVLRYGPNGERRRDELSIFVQSFVPRPRMLVFGAIDFAAAVARVGAFLGYRVTVCDARPTFATPARFPDADEVIVGWPHQYLAETVVDDRTVICVLTHDPKFDVPLLEQALGTSAAYIGAMGSRRTHDDRLNRLRERGVGEQQLARLAAPIGLDIGARTPEETAISVAAEIVAARWGGTGRPLTSTSGPIHHPAQLPRPRGQA
jgi:xanthine dehydrogenase accessory factor